ncbi:hypothetical protein [Pollutimonas bauzanensis]|uniref:TrbC/VIRB2 family protein n=1 Tax=Pollutimonas bauzanensis TaxID=658167 RepID=A0A1M5YI36_9BURK|nr:hypothetical protein [Pollutimonas bauzanensis]SHI11594.1 hypothetical protein SAMN04488135_109105 [Pollutimonas bauzanensis]
MSTFPVVSSLRAAPLPGILNTAIRVLLMLMPIALPQLCLAASGGLDQSVSVFEQIRDWLWLIIPVVCLIIGGILGAAYSADLIRKDTMYTWVVGVVFAGLVAGGIIKLVF